METVVRGQVVVRVDEFVVSCEVQRFVRVEFVEAGELAVFEGEYLSDVYTLSHEPHFPVD